MPRYRFTPITCAKFREIREFSRETRWRFRPKVRTSVIDVGKSPHIRKSNYAVTTGRSFLKRSARVPIRALFAEKDGDIGSWWLRYISCPRNAIPHFGRALRYFADNKSISRVAETQSRFRKIPYMARMIVRTSERETPSRFGRSYSKSGREAEPQCSAMT